MESTKDASPPAADSFTYLKTGLLVPYAFWATSDRAVVAGASRWIVFSEKHRVRLHYIVQNLCPPPRPDWMGGEVGGDEFRELDEQLRFKLGKLTLGGGAKLADRVRNFILGAPNDELLEMIELLPVAQLIAHQKALARGDFRIQPPPDVNERLKRTLDAMNMFLEECGSPARFSPKGRFCREGLADEVPRKLAEVPNRDALIKDLGALLKASEPVGVAFVDLDDFKQVNEKLGHEAGTSCLGRVVTALHLVIKNKGRLYRYGGDEFVAVIFNSDASEVAATGERIRRVLES